MPPAQYVPAGQALHAVGVVLVPAAVCRKPAAQLPTGMHALALVLELYVPLMHALQI